MKQKKSRSLAELLELLIPQVSDLYVGLARLDQAILDHDRVLRAIESRIEDLRSREGVSHER